MFLYKIIISDIFFGDKYIIVYSSVTGNIERFLNNFINLEKIKITEHYKPIILNKFILITSSTGVGEVISYVDDFMQLNNKQCIGLVCSGNKNWGYSYCKAVENLFHKYSVPVLMKFELSGVEKDINIFREIYYELFRIKLTSRGS